VGLWAYEAHDEADLVRYPVGLVQPFGDVQKAVAGMAVVPGGVLALDPGSSALHRYQREGRSWRAEPALALGALSEPEGLSVRAQAEGLQVLLRDDDGLHQGMLAWRPTAPQASADLPIVPAL